MDKNFKDMLHSISSIEPPVGLRRVVFERLEKERMASVVRKRLLFKIGFVISGIFCIFTVTFFGGEILSSEFFSIVLLGLSDMRTVMSLWQNYALSLLETLPTVSVAITLLPFFIFMLLLKQYAKLDGQVHRYSFKQ